MLPSHIAFIDTAVSSGSIETLSDMLTVFAVIAGGVALLSFTVTRIVRRFL